MTTEPGPTFLVTHAPIRLKHADILLCNNRLRSKIHFLWKLRLSNYVGMNLKLVLSMKALSLLKQRNDMRYLKWAG